MTEVRRRPDAGLLAAALAVALGGGLCGVAFAASPVLLSGWHGVASKAAGGHPAPGYLGIDVRDVRHDDVSTLKLKQAQGAVIQHVDHDGPAGKCGLREQDVILQMNGQAIGDQDRLRKLLRQMPAGHQVTLLIVRDGQQMTVTTQMANREEVGRMAWQQHLSVPGPSAAPAATAEPESHGFMASSAAALSATSHSIISTFTPTNYTGATVEVMGPQLAAYFGAQVVGGKVVGVLVQSVEANSPASDAGLHAGDVVLRVNGAEIRTSSLWYKLMRENRGKKISVAVLRDRREQTLTLVPDSKKRSALGVPPLAWDSASQSRPVAEARPPARGFVAGSAQIPAQMR